MRYLKARVASTAAPPPIAPDLVAYEQAKRAFDELDANLGEQLEAGCAVTTRTCGKPPSSACASLRI